MKHKGQLQDVIVIPVILLLLLLTVIPLLTFLNNLRATGSWSTEQTQILSSSKFMLLSFDSMTVFIFVILILLIGGVAFLVRSSPIGIPIVLFLGLAVILVGAILSNLFQNVASNSNLVAAANELPQSVGLFNKLPLFLGVGILIVLVLLFGKPQLGG